MAKKITTEGIIQRVKSVHGDLYDCSKVNYVNSTTPITLICSKHGEFKYYVKHLKEKRGCPICSKGGDTNDFIEKAVEIHGHRYDYSKSKYSGRHKKLIITCPVHGDFEQEAGSHLSGHGCPKCSIDKIKEKQKLPQEQFIKISNQVHNNRYDYSKTNYVNYRTKVEIMCPIHGSFWQRADAHLSGQGCPKCNQSKGEKYIEDYLIANNYKYLSQYEVAIDTSINPSGIAKVDFYLPEYNLFIEYNGKQHYIPVEYYGGKFRFEQQQKRDEFIRNYCKNNNILLLEIRYDDDIEKVLNKTFNANNTLSIDCQ